MEHDPYEILTSQLSSAVEVLGKGGVRPRDVAGLGITNQRETTMVWDRETGKPVYNAIVWQDRRAAALCEKLQDDGAEETDSPEDRAADRPLFFRHQDCVDSRQRATGARASAERASWPSARWIAG